MTTYHVQGDTPLRCAIDSNHRVAYLHPVRRGDFVLHVCARCLEDPAALDRGFAQAVRDLRAKLARIR